MTSPELLPLGDEKAARVWPSHDDPIGLCPTATHKSFATGRDPLIYSWNCQRTFAH
jgi:hypothetical protein